MDIEDLRRICLQLPKTEEEIKWGNDLVFMVGKKMFCISNMEHPLQFSLKVAAENFEEWCARPGVQPAPYLARANWILLQQPQNFSLVEIKQLIEESHRLVVAKLTKKQKLELGLS
jgi:predicted DNA-binding protein (MmcQ/YjbR family)